MDYIVKHSSKQPDSFYFTQSPTLSHFIEGIPHDREKDGEDEVP